VEVDLSHLASNLSVFRRSCGASAVLAVVKADAYGHGAPAVARELASQGVGAFGVATLEEGLALRKAGLRREILVFGPVEGRWIPEALRWNLGLSAWDRPFLDRAERAAARARKRLDLHLKVDSGMARLGFQPQQIPPVLEAFRSGTWPHLRMASAYTHLSHAPEASDRVSPGQLALFRGLPWPADLCLHAAGSAGSLRWPQARLSRTRPGIFLYGLMEGSFHPAARQQKPVLSLLSQVVALRDIPAGARVSYGGTFQAKKATRVATLAVGYADGLPRALSNRGQVLLHGRRRRILGRVCMDLCMVEADREVRLGDQAVLLGRQGSQEIGVRDWARLCGTITYEVTCGISARVPRVYQKGREGKV
jgi:alanine racemase